MLTERLPIRWITRFIIGYMVLAFLWWAIQLWRENDRSFDAGVALLEYKMKVREKGINITELKNTAEYRDLFQKWEKNRRMVFAEGLFFTLCLAFGLFSINRSANREIALARQGRNFMLSITHELKSPLAAIRLVLETICKRQLSKEQQDQLCKNALRDAARLQGLVDDLLLAARLESNWSPLSEPVDLKAIAQDSIRVLTVRFPQADIRLHVPEALRPNSLDKAGVTSVIHNLLENAVKYSPQGSPVDLSIEQKSDKVIITVSDQGPGIPDKEKKAVFEKFYRIGNEETRQATGTGLGLYIVQHVVKAHGGRIAVSDNVPTGTVFTIEV